MIEATSYRMRHWLDLGPLQTTINDSGKPSLYPSRLRMEGKARSYSCFMCRVHREAMLVTAIPNHDVADLIALLSFVRINEAIMQRC